MPATEEEVTVTDHAIDRFAERFPGECLMTAFGRSVRVGTQKFFRLCPGSKVRLKDVYYWDRETGAVFIAAMGLRGVCVVTVYQTQERRWA